MDDEVTEPEGSGCGGYVILTAAAAGLGAAIYAYSRDGFVILFWVVGAVLLWRAARKVHHAPDSTPPAPSERGPKASPQVTLIRDQSHPNRWVAIRPSEWLDWTDTEDRNRSE